jgi:hypothetical protein
VDSIFHLVDNRVSSVGSSPKHLSQAACDYLRLST